MSLQMVRLPLTEMARNRYAWKSESGNTVSTVAKKQALDAWASCLPVRSCFLATVNQRRGKCRRKGLKTLEKQHMKVKFPSMN